MEIENLNRRNQHTQPITTLPVFNNNSIVAEGWYFVLPSKKLSKNKIHSFSIGQQDLVVWRSANGAVSCLDAYCPHMGTHLGKGKVVNNNLQCFFHHWKFDGSGKCQDIPVDSGSCAKVSTTAYKAIEAYDSIWVFPKADPAKPIAQYKELAGHDLSVRFGDSYQRECHHHVTMINGLDPQHLKTVHNIDIEMAVEIQETNREIEVTLTGKIGSNNFAEKFVQTIVGKTYSYSMLYDHASNGFLTLIKDSYWFNSKSKIPSLYMIFAYRPLPNGKTSVQPIYLTAKRLGIVGKLKSAILLWLTERAFKALQGEDGEVYDNMRFNPGKLLPIDRPISQYIQYVNKLPISNWGKL